MPSTAALNRGFDKSDTERDLPDKNRCKHSEIGNPAKREARHIDMEEGLSKIDLTLAILLETPLVDHLAKATLDDPLAGKISNFSDVAASRMTLIVRSTKMSLVII